MEFTKAKRQEIVEEFARRHNGVYNPQLFLQEVKKKGPKHPAHCWFQWDDEKAANEHRLWQARAFAKDLRVNFTVEEVGRSGTVAIKTTEMPMVLSPVNGRKDGGGYVLTNPGDPAHMAEHCRQAGAALRSWLKRYEAALIHAGTSPKLVEQIAQILEDVKAPESEAA